MNITKFTCCLSKSAKIMVGYRDELCRLDTVIGDGDHGITIERGFLALSKVTEKFNGNLSDLFLEISTSMCESMGGAIGPIYSLFWCGASYTCKDVFEIDAMILALAMKSGVDEIMKVVNVKEGDKTVVDAMAPFARALIKHSIQHEDIITVLDAGVKAAEGGAQNTKNMIAHKGRARFMGEKSLGYVDAGATSFAIFVKALASEIKMGADDIK